MCSSGGQCRAGVSAPRGARSRHGRRLGGQAECRESPDLEGSDGLSQRHGLESDGSGAEHRRRHHSRGMGDLSKKITAEALAKCWS